MDSNPARLHRISDEQTLESMERWARETFQVIDALYPTLGAAFHTQTLSCLADLSSNVTYNLDQNHKQNLCRGFVDLDVLYAFYCRSDSRYTLKMIQCGNFISSACDSSFITFTSVLR